MTRKTFGYLASAILMVCTAQLGNADFVYLGQSAESKDRPNKPVEVQAIIDVVNISGFFDPLTITAITQLAKWDEDIMGSDGSGSNPGGLEITIDPVGADGEKDSGTYAYSPLVDEVMEIMTIKRGQIVDVFGVTADMQSGSWSINAPPDFSHATAWSTTAVPEPSAFLYGGLISGIVGLVVRAKQRLVG